MDPCSPQPHCCTGLRKINPSLLKTAQAGSVCGYPGTRSLLQQSQQPLLTDVPSLCRTQTMPISLLDIKNTSGGGCKCADSLPLQLQASQVASVTAGGCRKPTTLRLFVRRTSHLPDSSPELSSHGVKASVKGSIDLLGTGLPTASSVQASYLCSAAHQHTAQESE